MRNPNTRTKTHFSAALVVWGLCLLGCGLGAYFWHKHHPSDHQEIKKALDAADSPVVILPAQDLQESRVLPAILRFQLPTANHALTEGRPEKFYQFLDRTVNGVATQVWQGGMFGYVRTPQMLKDGTIINTKFHEGMDIAPVSRDRKGNPLDTVHSMADGIVVHANNSAGGSNYGKYVVVQHATNSGPFYSLYAHLSQVLVAQGKRIFCGDQLGVMGFTGAGITLRRAHCHVELNMLLSSRFSEWHAQGNPSSPNTQGYFNGQNLVGIDVAQWLRTNNENALAKLSDAVIAQGAAWKVAVPRRNGELEISQRYPWLRQPGAASAGWEITLAATGTPISVEPYPKPVTKPTVTWVKPFSGNHRWVSREMITGTGNSATLTSHGSSFVNLITGNF